MFNIDMTTFSYSDRSGEHEALVLFYACSWKTEEIFNAVKNDKTQSKSLEKRDSEKRKLKWSVIIVRTIENLISQNVCSKVFWVGLFSFFTRFVKLMGEKNKRLRRTKPCRVPTLQLSVDLSREESPKGLSHTQHLVKSAHFGHIHTTGKDAGWKQS